jgi:hypothetical protein
MGTVSITNTATQSVTSGTTTTVTLGANDIATTNSSVLTSNTTTSTITCVVAGIYEVVGRVNWISGGALGSGNYLLSIAVNGTIVQTIYDGIGSGALTTQPSSLGQTIVGFLNITNANTAITLEVSQNSGSAQTLGTSGANTYSWLFVHKHMS